MSLVGLWKQRQAEHENAFGQATDVADAVDQALRGLARPYADLSSTTQPQAAYAALLLDDMALTARRLLAAPRAKAAFLSDGDARLAVMRDDIIDGPLWLAVVNVASLGLFVFYLRELEPLAPIGMGLVWVLSTIGLCVTLAKVSPLARRLARLRGRRAVPWFYRVIFGLLSDAAAQKTRPTDLPEPQLRTWTETDVAALALWVRESLARADRVLAKVRELPTGRDAWPWRDSTTSVLQDLLGAAKRQDRQRLAQAAERLGPALLAEGIRAVQPDAGNAALFESIPGPRQPVVLRPALVSAVDPARVIARGQVAKS
ncbi:hypothetical protein AB0B31_33070 [Catellatospora citrea]|uniref:hypothetical protein n=1 Tax=Catellatospora citrea TaxID=53366 RepID=UPI0033FEE53F